MNGEYQVDERLFAQVEAYPQPKLVHGVGFPIGGTRAPTPEEIAPFRAAITRLGSPWASEHLSFNRVRTPEGEFHAGFLLPPLQSDATVEVAAANIRAVQALLPVPLAFETGVNYLRPRAGELSDGEFFRSVAERADCGILLDLHNLWCNERNGRQSVMGVLSELPLERVWEVHIAGGQDFNGYWLDAHSGPVPDPLLAIAAEVLPMLPECRAVTYEVAPEYLSSGKVELAELVRQLERIRGIWDAAACRLTEELPTRQHSVVVRNARTSISEGDPLPAPDDWETALGHLVARPGEEPGADDDLRVLAADLLADQGTHVLRDLVGKVRAGTIVDSLPNTARWLMVHKGVEGMMAVIEAFFAHRPPEPFAEIEAAAFFDYLQATASDVPHLTEVAMFDRAVFDTSLDGQERTVTFTCDPTVLLNAIRSARLPKDLGQGKFQVVVTP